MNNTMLQQVMTAPGQITFRQVPVPQPGPDQVLVRIKKIGVCGSDIHVYHGTHPYTSYPVTQGHEVSGQIAKLGENVKDFTVGQPVTIEPQVFCGRCYPCLHGKYNLCEKLKEISLPDSITVIGEQAFAMCFSLEKMEIPDSVMLSPSSSDSFPAVFTLKPPDSSSLFLAVYPT